MSNGMNVLFYSNSCNTCNHLLKLLENNNFLRYFKLLCVDGKLDQLPPHIRIVPTMIVTNMNKPIEGADTFKWVETMKFMQNKMIVDQNKIIQQNAMKNEQDKLVTKGYRQEEMGGFSDTFAYLNTDLAQPQSFFGYGEEKNNIIFTPPRENTKITKNQQDLEIQKVDSLRKQQDNQYQELMKQQQIMRLEQQEKLGQKNRRR